MFNHSIIKKKHLFWIEIILENGWLPCRTGILLLSNQYVVGQTIGIGPYSMMSDIYVRTEFWATILSFVSLTSFWIESRYKTKTGKPSPFEHLKVKTTFLPKICCMSKKYYPILIVYLLFERLLGHSVERRCAILVTSFLLWNWAITFCKDDLSPIWANMLHMLAI